MHKIMTVWADCQQEPRSEPPQQIAQPKKYEGNQLLLPQIISFLFHPCSAVLTNLCFSQT